MFADEVDNLGGKLLDAPERASANGLLGNDVEPDLHLVQPGGIGRRQTDVEMGMQGQPALHPGMLVGGIVADDQMNLKVSRDVRFDMFQKVEILLVAMLLSRITQYLPFRVI